MPTGKIGVYTRFFEYANFCLPLSTFLVNVPKHYRISRNYTLDEDTYPQFLRDNDKEMDLLSFIRTTNPTKVRVGKSQRAEGEPKLLDTTMGRVVLLLLVAPARASSELEASVKKLFNEGVSMEIVAKGAVFVLPKSQRKRKTVDSDAGEPLHPAKKLREDHKTSTGPSVVGKSKSALQRLLAGTVLNMEVRVAALPTLPFITSFVSVTPEIFSSFSANITEAEVDSFARPSIPLMTMATTVTSTADQTTTTKERFVEPSIFGGGSFSRAEHTIGRFSSLTGSDFIVGGIRTIVILDTDLQKVAEVRMRAEFNIREKRRLCSILEEKDSLLKTRDEEIKSLKSQLLDEIKSLEERNTTLEKETSVLDVKVADLAATVKVREQEVADSDAMLTTLEKFQDEQMAVVHEKFNKLYFDFFETCLHLEEMFYPHLLTTIVGHRWLLTYGMKLSVFKCLNSSEYFSALGAAISKAIEKGMQDRLAAEITHDQEDASVEAVMDLLCLDEALAERLGLNDSQPHVDQLMVPVHHSPDQTLIGARALSLSLDVSHGMGGTSSVVPNTTTNLSVTLASASTIQPISMDYYEITHAEDQGNAVADVDPFPNVDDAELIIS
ncbi:hypothetical protein Tco_1050847 [Tanacetum coccineum]